MRMIINMSFEPLFNMGNMYLSFLETMVEMKDIFFILD